MSGYPNAVVLQKNVYVGGGNAYDGCIVQMYNVESNQWSCLPRYTYMRFAMTVINNHLILVGGNSPSTWKATKKLAAFDPETQKWTYTPSMPTPRYWPAVATYDIWLLVAGGYSRTCYGLATVELLNTSTNQWMSASPLPIQCNYMTSAIAQNNWYLITNSKEVYRVSLPDIVSQTVDQSTASESPALWRCLPNTPLSYSAAIAFHGSLLIVGGRFDLSDNKSTSIYLYQPKSEIWTKVGDLPTACDDCACIALPSGDLLVAGGYDSSVQRTSQVHVASVQ